MEPIFWMSYWVGASFGLLYYMDDKLGKLLEFHREEFLNLRLRVRELEAKMKSK